MSEWNTLYVTGRPGFTFDLVDALKASGEDFLTGSYDEKGTYMFWVTESFVLRNLKAVLGGKAILKHRLRFFSDIAAFTWFTERNVRKVKFTPEQEQMFRDLERA